MEYRLASAMVPLRGELLFLNGDGDPSIVL